MIKALMVNLLFRVIFLMNFRPIKPSHNLEKKRFIPCINSQNHSGNKCAYKVDQCLHYYLTRSICYIISLCLWISMAYANPFDLYGVGSRAAALGNTGVAGARDYTAVFYNPAALSQATHAIGIGFNYALKDLTVMLAPRPTGYDLPNLGVQSTAVPTKDRLRERQGLDELNHTFTLNFGGSTHLGTEHLSLGFLVSLPMYHNQDSYPSVFYDEKEQYFSNQLNFNLVGGRVEHFIVQLGLAYQIFPYLSLGVGASVMPDAFTENTIYMDDPSQQDKIDLNVGVQTQTRWRLQGGLLFTPNPNFSMGASYRDEQYMSIRGSNEVQVKGLQDSGQYPFIQNMNIAFNYSPRQFTWGGNWQDKQLTANLDILYVLWSDFKGHHLESVSLNDLWIPRLGIEWKFITGQHLRLGIRYEGSPVPEQTGRNNFVDNNRTVLSIGSGHEIKIFKNTLVISWHAQFHILRTRTHRKKLQTTWESCKSKTSSLCDEVPDDIMNPDTGEPWLETQGLQTGNPGFPAYTSSGWIGQFGIDILWAF
jgi:long-chain fatty acid transport protein